MRIKKASFIRHYMISHLSRSLQAIKALKNTHTHTKVEKNEKKMKNDLFKWYKVSCCQCCVWIPWDCLMLFLCVTCEPAFSYVSWKYLKTLSLFFHGNRKGEWGRWRVKCKKFFSKKKKFPPWAASSTSTLSVLRRGMDGRDGKGFLYKIMGKEYFLLNIAIILESATEYVRRNFLIFWLSAFWCYSIASWT